MADDHHKADVAAKEFGFIGDKNLRRRDIQNDARIDDKATQDEKELCLLVVTPPNYQIR